MPFRYTSKTFSHPPVSDVCTRADLHLEMAIVRPLEAQQPAAETVTNPTNTACGNPLPFPAAASRTAAFLGT